MRQTVTATRRNTRDKINMTTVSYVAISDGYTTPITVEWLNHDQAHTHAAQLRTLPWCVDVVIEPSIVDLIADRMEERYNEPTI
jgi:hypothetical protein